MAQAQARIRALLIEKSEGGELIGFVPAVPPGNGRSAKIRAAIASTLLASLEMAREGEISLEQIAAAGPIMLHCR